MFSFEMMGGFLISISTWVGLVNCNWSAGYCRMEFGVFYLIRNTNYAEYMFITY